MTEINRQFVIQSPARVEHYAVRSRDWTMIYNSIQICRPDLPWIGAMAWAAIGAAIGGVFTLVGLYATPTTDELRVGVAVGVVCLFLISAICFMAAHGLHKTAKDRVSDLRGQMDLIRQEFDLEGPL